MKKTIGIFVLAGIITAGNSLTFANTVENELDISDNVTVQEKATPSYMGTTRTSSWSYTYSSPCSQTYGDWSLFYSGAPAERDGEYDTVSISKTYSHSYSGGIGGDIRDVEASLGFTFGSDVTYNVSKNSSSLKKGESIKAYWIKNYDVSTLLSREIIRITGFELGWGGQYYPVNRTESGQTRTATINKAIMPRIKLEYYDSKGNRRGIESLSRVEYYDYKDGDYRLINTDIINN